MFCLLDLRIYFFSLTFILFPFLYNLFYLLIYFLFSYIYFVSISCIILLLFINLLDYIISVIVVIIARPNLRRSLVHWTRALLRRNKEQFISNLAKVKDNFLVNNLRAAYQALRKLNSQALLTDTCSPLNGWADHLRTCWGS